MMKRQAPPASRSPRQTPDYAPLAPASARASKAARGASRKLDTRCEVLLRKALWSRGLRYRVAVKTLPGRPDIVFTKQKVAVFCDGDFWHGRDIERRLQKLGGGHNAPYWVAKISTNVARDRRNEAALLEGGWKVLRIWETDILRAPEQAADQVQRAVEQSRLPAAEA